MISFILRDFLRKKDNPRFNETENQLDSIKQSWAILYALERGIN